MNEIVELGINVKVNVNKQCLANIDRKVNMMKEKTKAIGIDELITKDTILRSAIILGLIEMGLFSDDIYNKEEIDSMKDVLYEKD